MNAQPMGLALQVALYVRKETALARYPRKLKLCFLVLFVILLVLPHIIVPLFGDPSSSLGSETEVNIDQDLSYAVKNKKEAVFLPKVNRESIKTHVPKTSQEIEAAAFNDDLERSIKLSTAPKPGLVEPTSYGLLPIVSKNGQQPWQVYARPFNHQDPRPRIALVISDMGLSRIVTDSVLRRLPPSVTLAFDVHAHAVGAWLGRARIEGHETLLSLPMEPYDYPRSDPGPETLLTTLSDADNIQRLLKFLGVGSGYVGVTTLSGSRFSADKEKMSVVLDLLKKRGLMILDTQVSRNSSIGSLAEEKKVPAAVNSIVIDSEPTPESIDAVLMSIEKTARVEGEVVALASPLPVTIDRLVLWVEKLSERGFVLTPLSAVVH